MTELKICKKCGGVKEGQNGKRCKPCDAAKSRAWGAIARQNPEYVARKKERSIESQKAYEEKRKKDPIRRQYNRDNANAYYEKMKQIPEWKESEKERNRNIMRLKRKDPDQKQKEKDWRISYYPKHKERLKSLPELEKQRRRDIAAKRIAWRRANDPKFREYALNMVRERRADPEKYAREKNSVAYISFRQKYSGNHVRRAKNRGGYADASFLKTDIFKRDKYTCEYCKKKLKISECRLDHRIPISKGGSHSWENCTTSCNPCNQAKAAKLLNGVQITIFDKVKE